MPDPTTTVTVTGPADPAQMALYNIGLALKEAEARIERLMKLGEDLHVGLCVLTRGYLEDAARTDTEAAEILSEIRADLHSWREVVPGKPLWFSLPDPPVEEGGGDA